MINTGLAEKGFWDEQNNKYDLRIADANEEVVLFFTNLIPWQQLETCFEVGCYPGAYLGYMGTKGLELNGVDITDKVYTKLVPFYKSLGLKTGFIENRDFFADKTGKKFDVVCSFGFIEHFENWQSVIKKHTELVNDNGYVIITTPNFRGKFQHFFHNNFDKRNLERHYIPSMNPQLWTEVLKQEGMEIIKAGYFGAFDCWVEETPPLFKRMLVSAIVRSKPLIRKLVSKTSESFSPFCGIIAKKTKKV